NPDPSRLAEFEEEIRSAVPIAKKLGVKKMCVVAGEETEGYSRDEQTRAVIAALKAGAEIGGPEGVTVILQPLNILVRSPPHVRRRGGPPRRRLAQRQDALRHLPPAD